MYIIINLAHNALVMQLVCCSHFFFGIIIVRESCVCIHTEQDRTLTGCLLREKVLCCCHVVGIFIRYTARVGLEWSFLCCIATSL